MQIHKLYLIIGVEKIWIKALKVWNTFMNKDVYGVGWERGYSEATHLSLNYQRRVLHGCWVMTNIELDFWVMTIRIIILQEIWIYYTIFPKKKQV